jgi:hypothetical protein
MLDVLKNLLHRSGVKDRELISRIRSSRLTYLSEKKLVSIAATCRELDRSRIPGAMLEAGCALGGSTILIASVKAPARALRVYDVFGMIPQPTAEDTPDVHERYHVISQGKSQGIGGDPYYGYENDLYERVQANLHQFGVNAAERNVSLIKGLLQDTMIVTEPIAFAHVDVDWYEPVKTCLERIWPHLSAGGSIILDDYFDWGGCRKATTEFLSTTHDVAKDDSAGSLKLTKRYR